MVRTGHGTTDWFQIGKGTKWKDNPQEKISVKDYQQGINFQNLQTAHTVQYQKNNQPNQKTGRRPK